MVSGGGSPSGPRSMWGELAPPTAPQERLCHGPGGRVRRLRRALVHGHLPGAADGADRLPGAAADRLPAAGARPTPPAAAAPGPLPQLRELPGVGLARA